MDSDSIRKAPNAADILRGNISPGDACTIRMIATIGERRMGAVHTVDSSLAQHYCEVIKVAEYVKDEPKVETPPAATKEDPESGPADITDRAMKPPPRGRRK